MEPVVLQVLIAKGSGDATLRRVLSFAASNGADAAREAIASAKSLTNLLRIRQEVAENIVAARDDAMSLADELNRAAFVVSWFGLPSYPSKLRATLQHEAPPVLFLRGNASILERPAIGFCGSRSASDRGIEIARDCASQLTREGTCIISGYAKGIDMAAHRAALEAGGSTIFVLAEGALRYQPKREVAALLREGNHLIISQFPPNAGWTVWNAMARNSTIISLSDAMILVQSGPTGGTFAAGEETLKRGIPLFVVDFAKPEPSAAANPYFIERGGIPIKNRNGISNLDGVREVVCERAANTEPHVMRQGSFVLPEDANAVSL